MTSVGSLIFSSIPKRHVGLKKPGIMFRIPRARNARRCVHARRCSTKSTRFSRDDNIAVQCTSFEKPLTVIRNEPFSVDLSPNSVVVEVRSIGVNFKDTLQCKGRYQQKLEPPFVPGSEAAGVVVAVGQSVKDFAKGDAVASMAPHAFQRYHVADEELIFKLPPKSQTKLDSRVSPYTPEDFDEAASLLCTHGTAYLALTERTQVKAGETVLITAAAGGVGLGAVGIAKELGATVIAAASNDSKLDLARQHGADHTINYTTSDLRRKCKELTNNNGVDVALDMCGGDLFHSAFKSLGWGGRLCIIGFASADIPSVNAGHLLVKNASVVGLWRTAYEAKRHDFFRRASEQVLDWWMSGDIKKPHIGNLFDGVDKVNEAFEAIKSRGTAGKVVLRVE